MWNGEERLVRNSVKTVAKLGLALRAERFSCRTFVSLVSLISYALHTTQLNPASFFYLQRAYRGVYNWVTLQDHDWDDPLPHQHPGVFSKLREVGQEIYNNQWWYIIDAICPTYEDTDYDYIIFTDASYAGWGCITHNRYENTYTTYQQRWERGEFEHVRLYTPDAARNRGIFNARHSAHAEPRAATLALMQLCREGLPDGSRVALVTDHIAIVHAQRRNNGFGGIGRGYSLNKLYEFTHDLRFQHGIDVTYFYIDGPCNPADTLSRTFGVEAANGLIIRRPAPTTLLPSLRSTYCPVVENVPFKPR